MKKALPILAIGVAALAAWKFKDRFLVSMPEIAVSPNNVLVGKTQSDHALFSLNAPCDVRAAAITYQYNSFGQGGDTLRKIGARGMLAFIDAGRYKHLSWLSNQTNQCIATYLNKSERDGEIRHLILVPKSYEALDDLRHLSAPEGTVFHLKGQYLAFQEGTVDGMSFGGQIEGASYFLVESCSAE